MTYYDLMLSANRKLGNGDITLGEYEEMIEPLKREIEPERKTGKIICSTEEITYGNFRSYIPHCKCSECNFVIDTYIAKFIKYCPNCGAKMEVNG